MFANTGVKSYLELLTLPFPLNVLQSFQGLDGASDPELSLELKGIVEGGVYRDWLVRSYLQS